MSDQYSNEELIEIIKGTKITADFIRERIEETFIVDRAYLDRGPEGWETHYGFVYYDDNCEAICDDGTYYMWCITRLEGLIDSCCSIDLWIGPIEDDKNTFLKLELSLGDESSIFAQKEIKVKRHVDEFFNELPKLVDDVQKILSNRFYDYCLYEYEGYQISYENPQHISKKEIKKFADEVLEGSLFPLRFRN